MVTFHGVFPDEDLYVAVLEAGIDIVTTADWITGLPPRHQPPAPLGAQGQRGPRRRLRARRLDVLRHRDEPRAEPDPRRRLLRRRRRHRERHHASSPSTCPATTPPTPGARSATGSRSTTPTCPAMLEKYTAVFADSVLHAGRLLRPRARRGRLLLRARRLHQGRRPRLVPAAQGFARRQLHQVPGPGRRRAPRRDPPRVADDAAHRPELGHQGLLHHPDQGRPADLQQAHDLPGARRGPLGPRRSSPRSA